jgi:ADP-ribosylation factor GTPase-activating protein 2/3
MGVHLTFVRSVDLDEWTQRQIDAMRIGGNDNAKKFFRKHGCTDFHTKTEKKYTSKAAVAYRAELAKLVEAEAAKRGEGTAAADASSSGNNNLFDNADAIMKKSMEDEARARVDAARNGGSSAANNSAGVLQPSAKLASQMAGAKGKLVTPTGTPSPTPPPSGGLKTGGLLKPPSNSGGPKLVLRKPGSSTASSRLLKKTSTASTASKLRVNKITTPSSTSSISDDAFEDVETTQKNIEESKKKEEEDKKRQQEEDAALAKQLQDELNGLGGASSATISSASSLAGGQVGVPATPTSTPASGLPAEPPKPKVSAMEENMAKLSAMNNDFFSGL